MRGKRKALSSHQIDVASLAISQNIFQTELFDAASIIFLYAALPYEVQTELIALEARRRSKIVAYPSTRLVAHEMQFYHIDDERELEYYECGKIVLKEPHPHKHQLILPDSQTLMIVPGMAFDVNKNRLGYGGGYYDRYLERYPLKTMGVAFDFSVIEQLPVDHYDKQLDCIVTQKRILG